MEIKKLERKDKGKWDEFVNGLDNSTIYHLSGWKDIVEEAYNLKTYYLFAEEDGEIKGILPLVSIDSKFLGNKLVSMPFVSAGGVLSNSPLADQKLISEATAIAENKGCDYIELRNISFDPNAVSSNSSFVTSILELKPDLIETYKMLPKSKRIDIKKANKRKKFIAIWNDAPKNFYHVYSQIMKDLGTPMHGYNYFDNILQVFPKNARILSIQLNERLIGSYLILNYKNTVIGYSGGSLQKYKQYYPGDFANWTTIEYACRNGFKYFDLGRSTKGSSNHIFKQKYNTNTLQLFYQYYSIKSSVPSYDLMKPRHRMFVNLWRNIPLGISKRFGPILRKNIP